MKLFFILALALVCPGFAFAAGDAAALARAIEAAPAGATLKLAAGEYDVADLRIPRDLTLIGDGEVILYSSHKLDKGLLVPVNGVSIRIENITFRGARSWDRNGAGVRHEGRDLTIVNCRFIDNEDGVLATGDENGVIEIVRSEFVGNGYGDGYSHGIYVSSGARLTISDSRFVGTKYGHHVKSLAGVTVITGSVFDDANGHTSYAVDASRGGDVTISGNSFAKAADADNNALFNYDLTRGGQAQALRITRNRIVNHYRGAVLLRNKTRLAPMIEDNQITNEDRARMTLE